MIICYDFDGVIHSYTSGWMGINIIPDDPVPGALNHLYEIASMDEFDVCIFSARSAKPEGIEAMQKWLKYHLEQEFGTNAAWVVMRLIDWPVQKPPAFLTIDDRAWTFMGVFPSMDEIRNFKPWYKQ